MSQVTMVGADLAEKLQAAHLVLFHDLSELSEAPPRDTPGHLRTRLIHTRHDLIDHFHAEERGGYFASIRNREPRLSHTLDQLSDEHRVLLKSLDDILAALERPHARMEEAIANVQEWCRKVREHEMREDDHLQDAFAQDLGAVD